MKRLLIPAVFVIFLALGVSIPNGAASHSLTPPAQMTNLAWHDDILWNSVVLGELHGPIPDQTLDAFYMIPGQNPVVGAGPGDSDYDGGRWQPIPITCAGGCPLFTDGDDVEAALIAGTAVAGTPGTPFLCPLTNPKA